MKPYAKGALTALMAGLFAGIGILRLVGVTQAEAPQPTEVVPAVAPGGPAGGGKGARADAHLDKTPPRQMLGLRLVKNGWTYNCMECHKVITARWHYDRSPNEHQHIRLEHGNNRFCLNCHHAANRNAFVDYDGAEIEEADVVSLCAKCHGTIYRDWLAGVHGRENGFWRASLGVKAKLRCIQCHDPHSPKFKPVKPMAPLSYPPRGAHPFGLGHAGTAATAR